MKEIAIRARLPVALLLALGCATGGDGESSGARSEVEFEVENDLVPRAPVTVRLLASDRGTITLGGVSAGQTRTFRHDEALLAGNYRLTAQVPQGETLDSQPFTLSPNSHVFWSLNQNDLTVGFQKPGSPEEP